MLRRSFLAASLAATCVRSAPSTIRAIAYVQPDGIWMREVPDGKPRRIAAGDGLAGPRLSSTGDWLSYTRSGTLHVIAIDGTGDRAIGKIDPGRVWPGSQWWPGRNLLLVESAGAIDIFSAADGWRSPARKLSGGILPVVFSADGSEMVYASEAAPGHGHADDPARVGQLWRVPMPGEPKLVVTEESALPVPAIWASGGTLYWLDTDFSASVMADGLEIFQVVAGGDVRPLNLSTLVYPNLLAMDPAGRRLAVSAGKRREEWLGKRIAIVDLGAGAVSHLTGEGVSAVAPAWSADGASIVYSAAPSEDAGGGLPAKRVLAQRRLWRVDAGGAGQPRQLTSDANYRDEAPVCSADGKLILFCRIDGSDKRSLWSMRPDGSAASQLAEFPAEKDAWVGYYGHVDWRSLWDWT